MSLKISRFFCILSIFVFLIFFITGQFLNDAARIMTFFTLIYLGVEYSKTRKENPYLNTAFNYFKKLSSWNWFWILFLLLSLSYIPGGFWITYHSGFDTGVFLQAISNTFHKIPFFITIELQGKSFLVNHFSPYLALLYPIKFLSYPGIVLYTLNYLCFASTFYLVHRILLKHLKAPSELIFSLFLCLLGHPFLNGLVAFEYHETNLLLYFYTLLFYFFLENRQGSFIVLALFCLFVRETVSISFIFGGLLLGCYRFFGKKPKIEIKPIYFLSLLVLGILGYILYFQIVKPWLEPGITSSAYTGQFSNLGSTNMQILLSPFLNTQAFIKAIFNTESILYIIFLILPLFPFMKWRFSLLLLPMVAVFYFSLKSNLRSSGFHYFGELFAPFFIICFFGLKEKQSNLFKFRSILLYFGFFWVLFSMKTSPIRGLVNFYNRFDQVHWTHLITKLPPPKKCSITNSADFLPFIATRFNPYETYHAPSIESLESLKCDYFFEVENPDISNVVYERFKKEKISEIQIKDRIFRIWKTP